LDFDAARRWAGLDPQRTLARRSTDELPFLGAGSIGGQGLVLDTASASFRCRIARSDCLDNLVARRQVTYDRRDPGADTHGWCAEPVRRANRRNCGRFRTARCSCRRRSLAWWCWQQTSATTISCSSSSEQGGGCSIAGSKPASQPGSVILSCGEAS
jgi:hypothetical protein